MLFLRILLVLFPILLLQSCSLFEQSSHNSSLLAIKRLSEPLNNDVVTLYINNAASELAVIQQQNTAQCIAGQLAIAQGYLDRANNESLAGMNNDVFITLTAFDRQMRKIRCVNQYINDQLGCGITNQNTVLKQWYFESDYERCNLPIDLRTTTRAPEKRTRHYHTLVTETLHDFNQEKIKPIYYESLNKLIAVTKSYPNSTLLITGHTDSIGNIDYNEKLSKTRAENVKKYFTDNGISPSRIAIQFNGERNIREVENTDVSRVFNRFTSITLLLDTRAHNNT